MRLTKIACIERTFILLLLLSSSLLFSQSSPAHLVFSAFTPSEIKVADMDNDGDNDYVSMNRVAIYWQENYDAQGTLSIPKIIVRNTFLPGQIISWAIADMDNDGQKDMVFGTSTNKLALCKNSAGEFAPPIIIDVSFTPKKLMPEDVNGDGFMDIVGHSDNPLGLFWMPGLDGNGNFGTALNFENGTNYSLHNIESGDIDGDNDIDFLIAGYDVIFLYENTDGQGSFFGSIFKDNTDDLDDLFMIDMDADGDKDVLYNQGNKPYIMYNDANAGVFSAPVGIATIGALTALYPFDFDADGDIDVAAGSYSNIRLVRNNGNGAFTNMPFQGGGCHEIIMADMNGDGAHDLLTLEGIGVPYLYFYLPTSGTLGTKQTLSYYDEDPRLAIGFDMDNDGDNDIVTASGMENKIVWFDNLNGYMNVGGYQTLSLTFPEILSISNADIDGDGFQDLLINSAKMIAWYRNKGTSSANFGPLTVVADQSSVSTYARKALATDVDGDGDLDVVAAWSSTLNQIIWYENNGNGSFPDSHSLSSAITGLTNIAAGDVDNDGDVDIVSATSGTTKLSLHINDGLGGFAIPYLIANQYFTEGQLTLADLNADGLLDVVGRTSATSSQKKIQWAINQGNGSYNHSSSIGLPGLDYVVADMNGDNVLDIVTLDANFNWFKNTIDTLGNISFENTIMAQADYEVSTLTTSDLDGDGDPDLLAAGTSDYLKEVVWVENIVEKPAIAGTCFWDENQNGLFDTNEKGLLNQRAKLNPTAAYHLTNGNGRFNFYVVNGDYRLTVEPDHDWELTTMPDTFNITIDHNSFLNNNFGFQPIIDTIEMEADLVSGIFRCNRDVPFWLNATNTGTAIVDGWLGLRLNPELTLENVFPTPDTILVDTLLGDSLVWNFEELYPSYSISPMLTVKAPNETFTAQTIASSLVLHYQKHSQSNIRTLVVPHEPILLCSYDPNDKQVHPDREGDDNLTLFDEKLEYTIRFQNTGNDTAFNIRIADQLSDKLDWNTFELASTSHPVRTVLHENGELEFFFDNILLPDSTTNYVGSQGFVKFKIRSLQGLSEQTSVTNTAGIYFDFNPPIITNTVKSTLVSQLFTKVNTEYSSPILVSLYPNPASGYATLHLENPKPGQYELNVVNMFGQVVSQQSFIGSDATIKYDSKGMVFYQIIDRAKGRAVYSGKVVFE